MTEKVTVQFLTIAFVGLLFSLMSVPVIASSDCGDLKGCERKFCEIERQLKIAQEKGNKRQINGLKKSLENARDHCTDEGLRDDLLEKIEDANNEIADYEFDLKEAKESEKTDKVRKYQGKIEEEKNRIKRLEDELSNN